MLFSQLFGKPQKTIAHYESKSHELLIKGGFINQVASGIFNLLPLGKRVLTKIENIIRQEMDYLGAQEIEMPLLHPKTLWEITNRWNSVDVLYKTKSRYGQEYALAPTHEEIITPLVKKFIKSYKDLPLALYHITKKFRDEPRPKSGILRGREFGMKDLYSFHPDKKDLENYYQKVIKAYLKIFSRCGLTDVKITQASGGSFTKKFSHEFNVITQAGEVDLIFCQKCVFAQNLEIFTLKSEKNKCPQCHSKLITAKAIEIGNIFDLDIRFSQAFDLKFVNQQDQFQYPFMGCYGIGTTRLLGAVVEISHDEKGIIWPKEIAPYQIYLIGLDIKDKKIFERTSNFFHTLKSKKIEVIFDDRLEVSAGEKLNNADLLGIPIRLIISKKTGEKIEYKQRNQEKIFFLTLDQILNKLNNEIKS